jgi:hypothetical protein
VTGTPCRTCPGPRVVIPYLLRTRTSSTVCFPQRIDVEDLVAWLDATNAARPASERVTLFHVLVTAVARTVRLRPEVNRFVAGRRTYQHRDISVSFVVKSELSDAGTESEARLVVDGWETVLPGPLMDAIPLYTSVYLVNAGSLGIDAPFHHLHETGTAGVVVSIGRVAPEPVVDEAGHVVVQALTRDDTGEALARAQDVRGLEAALGVDVELDVQQWALTTVPWLVSLATWFYVWGYVPVVITSAAWLRARRPEAFRRLRTALLARVGCALHPALMALAVVVTGNHWLLDLPAGLALTGVGLLAAATWPAARPPGPGAAPG